MRRFIILGLCLFVGLLGWPLMSSAQTNLPLLGTNYGVGVRAIGMGGAFVGIANDYSATYWNPAGLGQIRRMELTGNLNSLFYQTDTEYFYNQKSEQTSFTNLNSVGFVLPVPTYRGSLVFALGYNKVKNYNSSFSIEGFNDSPMDSVHQEMNEFDRGSLNQWVLGGSIQMSEHLFLGGSINFWTGNDDYSWEKQEWDVLDMYWESYWLHEDQIDTKINGVSFKFASLYNLYNWIRFGATIETPVTYKGEESWRTHDRIEYDEGFSGPAYWDSTSSGQYEYKIRKPLTINLGASLSLPLLTLSGDVTFNDWSQIEYTEPEELESMNNDFLKNLKPTARYRIGAELVLPLVKTRLRAGYMMHSNPYKENARYTDKQFISAGAGILLDRQFTIDAAVVHGWWDYVGTGNYDEEIKTFNYFVSGSFRF